jgi:uncharacterized protein YkwD
LKGTHIGLVGATSNPLFSHFIEETSCEPPEACARMRDMREKIGIFLFILVLMGAGGVHAQADANLLSRINNLRTSLGLTPYNRSGTLDAAAAAHAQWMVNTGQVSHTEDDGSTPRTRAAAAGYASQYVSENIYGGTNASPDVAWNFWINSSIHYRGLTSPNYQDVGIGWASSDWGTAYVLLFGGGGGSWTQSAVTSAGASSGAGAAAAVAPPPSFVVGVDTFGNIMHEIQPGDTLGDIALIYGYTWDDIPYMLEINGMTETGIRELEIGAVFLVPPQDGTYTPTPPLVTETATPTPTPPPTATGEVIPPAEFAESTAVPTSTPQPTASVMRIATAGVPESVLKMLEMTTTPTATPAVIADTQTESDLPTPALVEPEKTTIIRSKRSPWFMIAVGVQVVVLLGAGFELLRHLRR